MTTINMIAAFAGFSVSCLVIAIFELLRHKRRRKRRRKDYDRQTDRDGIDFYDDGAPGGPRGLVWSEKQRAEHRRDRQRRKLRVVQ